MLVCHSEIRDFVTDKVKVVMKVFDVYSDEDNWYFSEGIKRDFGCNKLISLSDGRTFLNIVQPLKCVPEQNGLVKVGTIKITKEEL